MKRKTTDAANKSTTRTSRAPSLPKQLEALTSADLLRMAQRKPELEYLFRHGLIQDAAYQSLLKADRRTLHQLVGETLESLYPKQLDELAPMLAHHFDAAGDEARALRYFDVASEQAARKHANAEVLALCARALTIAKQDIADTPLLIKLYLRHGRALELGGHYDQALLVYAEMQRLAHARADQAIALAALLAQATVHATFTAVSDLTLAAQLSEQALTLARTLGDPAAEATSLWNLLLVYRSKTQYVEAVRYGEQALEIARAFNLRERLAYLLNDLSFCYANLSQLPRAQAALAEAEGLWRDLGNWPLLADNLSRKSMGFNLLGAYAQAIQCAQEGHRLSQLAHNAWAQMFCLVQLGPCYFALGDINAGLTACSEALRLSAAAGSQSGYINGYTALVGIYLDLGAWEQSLETAQQFVNYVEKTPLFAAVASLALARAHVQRGDVAQAQLCLAQAHASAPMSNIHGLMVLARVEIELALAENREADALTTVTTTIQRIRQAGFRGWLAEMLGYQGQVLLRLARFDEARLVLTEARELATATNARLVLWQICGALSELEAQRGNHTEAQVLRQQARELIAYIADHCPPELRESFLALADVRAVMAR